MTFLLIPTTGPSRLVERHPTGASVSDALGGATMISVPVPAEGIALVARELVEGDNSDSLNLAASVIATAAAGRKTILLGPVALCALRIVMDESTGSFIGQVTCMSREDADAYAEMTADLWAAHGHHDNLLSERAQQRDGWADDARRLMSELATTPYPENLLGESVAANVDPIAQLFAKLGIDVAPKAG